MDKVFIDHILFEPDINTLLQRLRIKPESLSADALVSLLSDVQAIANPKALYKQAYVEEKGQDYVVIDGIRFTSRILRVNLDTTYHVFPFLATCGVELERYANSIDDLLQRFWVDTIMEFALYAAVETLQNHLIEHHQPGIASMNPGSLEDWPLTQQRPLFDLLGRAREATGVQLTDSFLMVPVKSVSGIYFPTEESFVNCQLCPREICPGRRAPYDPTLMGERYS